MKLERAFLVATFVGLSSWLLTACDKANKPSASAPEGGGAPRTNAAAKPPDATCLSPIAASTIQEIIADGVEARARGENKGAPEERRLDLSKVRAIASLAKVDLQDVLTSRSDPNSTKKFCEATLSISVSSDEIQKADELRRQSGLNSIKSVAEDAGFRVDVNKFSRRASYSVQPTDDGLKILVSLEAGAAYVNLVGEAALWAAANTTSGQVQANAVAKATREQPPTVPAPVVSAQDQGLQEELAKSLRRFNATEREINVVWNALPQATRDANLPEQRQFNKDKESTCFRQATEAGTGAKFEIAKNNCWADMYDKRTPQLKALN